MRFFSLIAVLALMAGIADAQHHGTNRVMGTVAGVTDTTIIVDTPDGKSQTVVLTTDTKYTRMNTVITLKDIQMGDQVVIQTIKKGDHLTALTVKVGVSATHHHSGRNS
jgi:hypothetical protein